MADYHSAASTPFSEGYRDHTSQQYYPSGGLSGFEVIPEEVTVTHDQSGAVFSSSPRLADAAFSSWRIGRAQSTSLTSGLSLSTRSSNVDLKEFIVQRGNKHPQGLHKAASHGDQASIMQIMKHLGPEAPINDLDINGCTPLMYAAMADSRQAIEMLLNFSARREQTDSEGRTAVHYAAFFGKQKSLKFLVDTASDWTSRDSYGRTPLHWASLSKGSRCLTVLLKHASTVMGDINPRDNEGLTPLHCAAHFCRPRNIVLLSEAECDFMAVDSEEKTALHWTANNNDSSCIQAILDIYHPLLNRRDATGSTILHLTASNGSTHLVEALLREAGIDIDVRDNADCTPLHYCCLEKHDDIAKLLMDFGALDSCIDSQGYTALHYAVQIGSLECVEVFSRREGVAHLPDANEGKTPLMLAVQNKHEGIVQALLENAAVLKTINHVDRDKKSALHLAAQAGSSLCVSLLLSHGADPNLYDIANETPLSAACIEGHVNCIQPLVLGGAETNLIDTDGHTPLLKSVLSNQSQSVKALALAGVDLNQRDSTGATALHVAAYNGEELILRTLLENGANPNFLDLNGLSCAHMVALGGHTHCISVLVRHRAYLSFMDAAEERLTPLDYATSYGYSGCAEELIRCGAVSSLNIRNMAAISIQTCFRGFRARRLRVLLIHQNRAATVLASHIRCYLQQKRYQRMRRRHYAAITIQAAFRGYLQRCRYHIEKERYKELGQQRNLVENFARLVTTQVQQFSSFTKPNDGFGEEDEISEKEGKVGEEKERKARLEAAMKMREIYEEKQKRWVEFRAAENQRRIDKARQQELDRLAAILHQSRAKRKYSRVKFHQTLTVRTHWQAAVIIQRSFRAMRLRNSWQRRIRARREMERGRRENEAAEVIQRAWRRHVNHLEFEAAYYRSVFTSPVVPVHKTLQTPQLQTPSYKKSISITGNPRRKVNETLVSGFRVPRPATQNLPTRRPWLPTPPSSNFIAKIPIPTAAHAPTSSSTNNSIPHWKETAKQLRSLSVKEQHRLLRSRAHSFLEYPSSSSSSSGRRRSRGEILPELVRQTVPQPRHRTRSSETASLLPQIVPT